MDTKPERTCPTCSNRLPANVSRRQKYCSVSCRERGARRRRRGQPEADRGFTPEEDATRSAELVRLRQQNRKLRNLAVRLAATRRKHQRKAEASVQAVATARRRADAAEIDAAATKRQCREELSRTQAKLSAAERRIEELEPLAEQNRYYKEQLEAAEDVLNFFKSRAERFATQAATATRTAKATDDRRLPSKVLRDWNYLAGRYFRNRSPEMWNEHDRSIYKTWTAYLATKKPTTRRTR